jgi:hypothetical protein
MSPKQSARIAGACFLIAMVTSIAGGLWITSVLDTPADLARLAAQKLPVSLGVLLELVNGIAVVGIAAAMFPFLRVQNPALATGYLGVRIVEAAMQAVASIVPLALLSLSQGYLDVVPAGLEPLGAAMLAFRAQALTMLGIFFCVGALLFYALLYRSRLIPRWLSIWGLVAALSITVQILGDFFGVDLGFLLPLPIITNEVFLGVWLIVKGFRPAAVAARE